MLSWHSVDGKLYNIERSRYLMSSFEVVASNVPASSGMTYFLDGDATNLGAYFYRVTTR